MKVIVINGSATSGKDTFVDIVDYICSKENYFISIDNISTIDPIKELAKYIGWNGNKDDKSRKFLSDLKLLVTEYNNFPFEYIVSKIGDTSNYNKNSIIFVHIREPEEIRKIVDHYKENCVSLLIKRDNVNVPDNMADKNVDNYEYDYIIYNNLTINDLKAEAYKFLLQLGVI